jgi:broad specificity phosphatase PhoE
VTRLLLVRHGLHDWVGRAIAGRMAHVSLNSEGLRQVEGLAYRLRDVPLDAIYSSPQPRAQQTAAPIARLHRLQVQIAPEFDEVDMGEWVDRSFADLERDDAVRWKHWVDRRASATAPGGEPFVQVRERAMRGVERLRAARPQGTLLVASHGDVIKAVVATLLRMSLDDLETFDVACASVTVIDTGEGWALVKQVSGTAA